jgi:hypothetical protein
MKGQGRGYTRPMIDPDLDVRLKVLEQKIDATYNAAEKTRKYLWWTLVITAAVILLPLLFLPYAVNSLLSTYSTALNF